MYNSHWKNRSPSNSQEYAILSEQDFIGKNYTTIRSRMQAQHGVLIWQTASFRFQPDVSLKRPCPASLGVRERVPCPHSRPASAREARLPWREDPSGHPASMAGRAPGHAEAAGRRMARALRHCRPPFVMTRNSFEGCRARSRLTSVTVLPGCRAHIHIPNDRATIIADITFRSHRRVKASSW